MPQQIINGVGKIGFRSAAPPPSIVTNGLILNLDASKTTSYPGSGAVWYDISGNNLNASLINGPTFNSSNGGSIVFDGTNKYAEIANTAILNNNTQTISVWYRVSSFGSQWSNVVGKHSPSSSTTGYMMIDKLAGGLKTAGGTGFYLGVNGGSLNTWYFTTLSFVSGTSLRYYINGSLHSSSGVGAVTIASNPLRIAKSVDSFWSTFNGRIGQIIIHNRQLTDAEVLQNYNVTKSRFGL